jgi:ADP-ribosyl-[dinitrogen reductase] hydrolase
MPGENFEDRFTGALLGMAIGDALGVPYAFEPESKPQLPLRYQPRLSPDGNVEIPQGQFSFNTELALCLLETIVTSDGFVDPELAAYRFEQAAARNDYLLDAGEIAAIKHAADREDFQGGGNELSGDYAGPASRIAPVALVHALSDLNVALIVREVMRAVLVTQSSPLGVNGALAVAHALRLVLRSETPLELVPDEVLSFIDEDAVARAIRAGGTSEGAADVATVVSWALQDATEHDGDFETSLRRTYERGGATHLTGAIVGALCGAFTGAKGINPELIDGLEGRAYVLMAAPALLRAAQLRAGVLFQLRVQ